MANLRQTRRPGPLPFARGRPGALFLAVLFFLLLLPLRAPEATIVILKPEKQEEKEPPCCRLGIAYRSGPGLVVLDRICRLKGRTVVHLRTVRLPGVCTYPPATVLRDGRGRRYRMLTHTGLPNCTRGTSRKPSQHFTWVFQPLRRGIKKMTLVEMEDDATAGYSYWAWRGVDVSRCGF